MHWAGRLKLKQNHQDTMSMSVLCSPIDNILKFGPVISNSSEPHVWNTNIYKSKAAYFVETTYNYKFLAIAYMQVH